METISNKTSEEVDPDFLIYDTNLDPDIRQLLEAGHNEIFIRTALTFFQNLNFPDFKPLILDAMRKDNKFIDSLQVVEDEYGPGDFEEYSTFRIEWLRDLDHNCAISTNSIF